VAAETKGAHNCAGTDCSCTVCGHEHVIALAHVDARSSTCIEKGCIEHYRCICGELFADSKGNTPLTESEVFTALSSHTWSEEYSADGTDHWKTCTVCGGENEKHEHSVPAGQHRCSVCEYWLSHELESVEGYEAECSHPGLAAHYRCKGCGSLFRDAEGTQAVTEDELIIEPLLHRFGDWTAAADGVHHIHTCADCPFSEEEEHVEDPAAHSCTVCNADFAVHVDETPADCTHEGTVEHYRCSNCGELFILNEGSQETVLADQLVAAPLGHLYDNTWNSDENGHHLTCTRCNESEDAEPHRDDGTGKCVVCGCTITKLDNLITLDPAPEGGRISIFFGETPDLPEASAKYGEPIMTIRCGGDVVSDFSAVGSYTVTWNVPESESYSAASASIDVIVSKAKNSIGLSTADSEATFTYADQVELPAADSDYGEVVQTITKDGVSVEAIDDTGTYVVTWTVAEDENYLGAEASFTVIVTGPITGPVCEGDAVIKFSELSSGDYRLFLNGIDAGLYSFEKVSGGYTIRNTETEEYVCFDSGSIVYRTADPTVWAEADSSFTVTVTETTRWWLIVWHYNTKTTRYYLNADSNGTLTVSKNACVTHFGKHYAGESHCFSYTGNGNGTHTGVCEYCGYSFTDNCVYGEDDHCTACGSFDISKARVTGVDVSISTSNVKGGLKLQGWKLVYIKAYTQYTAHISVTAEGTAAAFIEYSTDGTSYATGSDCTASSNISKLWIRVTDTNGKVTNWLYENGRTTRR